LLVSGATRTFAKYKSNPHLGRFVEPKCWSRIETVVGCGKPWAVDNGAFGGFQAKPFLKLLDRVAGWSGCLFVACPDVVGNAKATLNLFPVWRLRIRDSGLPVALVGQDGLEEEQVPWDEIDALFLGGSTAWKLGSAAQELAGQAKARGKWIHMGRVNSRKRIRTAFDFRCDSIDGSGFSRWPDIRLPKGLRWIEEVTRVRRKESDGR
jgi:hypothetical protein